MIITKNIYLCRINYSKYPIYMKRIVRLCMLIWACTMGQQAIADNPYGVSDELFAYWYHGVEHLPDSVTEQVADSILRLAEKEDDDHIRLLGESLTYMLYYYRFDEENFRVHSDRCKALTKQMDDHHMYVTTVTNVINFYNNIGQAENAMAEAQDLLNEGKRTGDIETLILAYNAISTLCYTTGDYEQCIAMVHLCLAQYAKDPNTGFNVLTSYKYLAESFHGLNQIDSCEYYLQIAEKMDPNFAEAPYLRAMIDWSLHEDKAYFLSQYNKIMSLGASSLHTEAIYRQQLQMMKYAIEGDIENAKAMGILEGMSRRNTLIALAEIYTYARQYKEAARTYKQLASTTDSIQNVELQKMQSRFRTEMETMYETKQKEARIMRQTYTLKLCAIGLIALLVVLYLMYRSNRDMRLKNQALTLRINEMLDAKQRQRDMQQAQSAPEPLEVTESADNNGQKRRQIERVIYEIVNRQLFSDPDFKRDDLLDQLNIAKRGFGHDFESIMGESFAHYLLGLRMDFAAQQIREHPDYTNDTIAQMCGIPSRSSFYRNFSEYFGLSPVAYHDSLSQNK